MKPRMDLTPQLALLLIAAVTTGCGIHEPDIKAVGSVVSSDGKRVLTAYVVVPGGTLEDYLALNLAPPGASYSPEDTLASFSKVSKLHVFWTHTGKPALVASHLEGVVFVRGKPSELLHCQRVLNCPAPDSKHAAIAIERYPTNLE